MVRAAFRVILTYRIAACREEACNAGNAGILYATRMYSKRLLCLPDSENGHRLKGKGEPEKMNFARFSTDYTWGIEFPPGNGAC